MLALKAHLQSVEEKKREKRVVRRVFRSAKKNEKKFFSRTFFFRSPDELDNDSLLLSLHLKSIGDQHTLFLKKIFASRRQKKRKNLRFQIFRTTRKQKILYARKKSSSDGRFVIDYHRDFDEHDVVSENKKKFQNSFCFAFFHRISMFLFSRFKSEDSSNYKQQHSSRSISPSGTNRRRSGSAGSFFKNQRKQTFLLRFFTEHSQTEFCSKHHRYSSNFLRYHRTRCRCFSETQQFTGNRIFRRSAIEHRSVYKSKHENEKIFLQKPFFFFSLRTIIAALQCNILIRKDDLVRNLDYVANVLESVHQDETRFLINRSKPPTFTQL